MKKILFIGLLILSMCKIFSEPLNAKQLEKKQEITKIKEIEIPVNGLVCPFCSNGLERAFAKTSWIKKITNVDIKKGMVRLLVKDGTKKSFEEIVSELSKIVEQATFTFGDVSKVKIIYSK